MANKIVEAIINSDGSITLDGKRFTGFSTASGGYSIPSGSVVTQAEIDISVYVNSSSTTGSYNIFHHASGKRTSIGSHS